MAKLQTYKFVNPGSFASKDLAVIAAKKQTLAINRLGATVSSIGNIVKDIESVSILRKKEERMQEIQERRQKRRERDLEAENKQEATKSTKRKRSLSGTAKKAAKKSFGFLEKFLGPIGQTLLTIGGFILTKEILEWVADPNNTKKLRVFVEKTAFVVKKIFGWAAGFTKNIFEGVSALVDPNGDFVQKIGAIGTIMKGVIGLKYLMNPFSLITDILGLLDLLTGGGPDGGKGPDGTRRDNRSKSKTPASRNSTARVSSSAEATPRRVTPKTQFTSIQDTSIGSPERSLASKVQRKHGQSARQLYEQAYDTARASGASPHAAATRANARVDKAITQGKIKSKPQFGSLSARSNRIASTVMGEVSEEAAELAGSKIFGRGIDRATQRFFLKILGMGGVKTLKKILNRIPIIGPLITFALNWAAGESIAKSAAMAVGAGLGELIGGWAGGAIGAAAGAGALSAITTPLGVFVGQMLGGIAGEALGGWLYSTITGEGGGEGGIGAVGKSIAAGVKELFNKDWGKIGQGIMDWIGGTIMSVGSGIWGAIQAMAEFMGYKTFFAALWNEIKDLAGAMVTVVKKLKKFDFIGAGRAMLGIVGKLFEFFVAPGPIGFIWENGVKPFFDNVGKLWSKRDKLLDFLMRPGTFQETFGGQYKAEELKLESVKPQDHMQGGSVQEPQEMFLGGVVKGIGKAVSGIGNAVKNVVSNPIVQTAASFIPGAAPIMAGIGAISGLASGNPMAAITQGLGMIPGMSGIMSGPIGNIAGNLMSGNLLGAATTGLGMINPAIGQFAGSILSGGFNPMNMLGGLANQFGMGGIYKAITGAMGGDYMSGIKELGSQIGVDPKILGAVQNTGGKILSKEGFSAEYAMQQALEFVPVPVIMDKIVPMPTPVPINTGAAPVISAGPSSLTQRTQ